jgi:hypothetical protein
VDVAGRAAATRPLQQMSSSCRCSPPSLAAPACSGRLSARIASRRPSAAVPPHYRDHSPGVPASVRREPSGCASPPSLRARLPMRCPGFGGSCAPVGSRLRAVSHAGCRGRSAASAHLAGGSDPASAFHGIRAAESSAEMWPSPPYKGTREARIVSARRGELLGSFQRVQVRTALELTDIVYASAPGSRGGPMTEQELARGAAHRLAIIHPPRR